MSILELDQMREELAKIGNFSQTSDKYQDDILALVRSSSEFGTGIVEIGCYRGGLTVQIAKLAAELGLKLDVVDVDEGYLQVARSTVAHFGLQDSVAFHLMDFPTFIQNAWDGDHKGTIVVDGDHHYAGVVADIRAIRSMRPQPYAIAFHDYSLRYSLEELADVRVDRAIEDEFGGSVQLLPIGEIAGNGHMRTAPGPDGHYHERGKSEGVVIKLKGS